MGYQADRSVYTGTRNLSQNASLRCSHFTCISLKTMLTILISTLITNASAALGMKTWIHSPHLTGLTSVSIHPAPLISGPPLTFGVTPSSAGKRLFSTKYCSMSSFSRHRARTQSPNSFSSWSGMSAMRKRRQCMLTDLGGRPWKYVPRRVKRSWPYCPTLQQR
jgi:hypothetical protein